MSTRSAAKVDTRRRSAGARPSTQRPGLGRTARPSRPNGVPGPELAGSVTSMLEFRERRDARPPMRKVIPTPSTQSRLRVPPAVLESEVRLTDRGLAVVMILAIVLVVVALVCVTTTALRVTAEPSVAPATATTPTAW